MAKNSYSLGQVQMKTSGGGKRGGMNVAEKPKDFTSAWMMVLRYSKPLRGMIILGISCAILSVILTLFGPDTLTQITNLISDGMTTGKIDTETIVSLTVRIMILYILGALITYVESYTMTTYSARLTQMMRKDISHKLNSIPLSRSDSSSFGDLLSRVTNDVDTLNQALDKTIAELVVAIITFLGCMIMMFVTNVQMALSAIFFALLGFIAMRFIIRYSQPFFSNRSYFLGSLNGHIEEMYAGHIIVKGYNGEEESEKTFSKINDKLYQSNWKSQFLSGMMMPIMGFIGNLGYVAVCVVGAALAMNGTITFGVITAFMIYVRQFQSPVQQSSAKVVDRVVSTDADDAEAHDGGYEMDLVKADNHSRRACYESAENRHNGAENRAQRA